MCDALACETHVRLRDALAQHSASHGSAISRHVVHVEMPETL
jgi:hypothetical protein